MPVQSCTRVVCLLQDEQAAEATEALLQRELARQEGVHTQHLNNALQVGGLTNTVHCISIESTAIDYVI